ncbi:MAG TPA: hypothetical protein DDW19_00775 [Anaerolineaceae bacterium]|jgi:hypothetical protein|nr:hypothetical protein [Anaerolineaceae bacterium]
METLPFRLIDEPIEVAFSEPPLFEKKPPCPTSFTWQGENYPIIEVIAEWEDYRRKGKMERNMVPGHIRHALRKGSWGVGRFYFRVRVKQGNLYEIYFDRAPESAGDRKGHWFILGERRNVS